MQTSVAAKKGDVIGGKYRVDRVIGRGGMGVVVCATHIELGHRVAVKLLTQNAEDVKARRRFLREARAAARLLSPHSVRVFDIGELDTGAPYIVMEYLKGEDLRELVERGGPLAIGQTVDYILQASEALAEAHAVGIVHRDLKPSNLFLDKRAGKACIVKVLDFGISKLGTLERDAADELTSAESLLGTPHYMAPEQMMSAATVDARADIWSLGGILYYLCTARKPFQGSTVSELMIAVITSAPDPPRQNRPDLPEDLERVVLRCLCKDANDRYASVVELADALAPFGSADAPQSAEEVRRISQSAGTSDSLRPGPPSSRRWASRQRQARTMTSEEPTVDATPTRRGDPSSKTALDPLLATLVAEDSAQADRTVYTDGDVAESLRAPGLPWRGIAAAAMAVAAVVVAAAVALRWQEASISNHDVASSAAPSLPPPPPLPASTAPEPPPAAVTAAATVAVTGSSPPALKSAPSRSPAPPRAPPQNTASSASAPDRNPFDMKVK